MSREDERQARYRLERMRRAAVQLYGGRRRLTPAMLRHFATPIDWPEIMAIDARLSPSWWRDAVLDADEYGRGWLRWLKGRGWTLTDRGRVEAGLKDEPA